MQEKIRLTRSRPSRSDRNGLRSRQTSAQIALDAGLAIMVYACFPQVEFKNRNNIENAKTVQGGANL